MTELKAKLRSRSAHVVVIGVGYVGLPLAIELARSGFFVTGLEADPEKVRQIGLGESYVADVPSGALSPLVAAGRLRATLDPRVLAEADVVIICVPTPLNKTRDPDLCHIVAALEQIAEHQHGDMLVVLESTTYPGTTRELLVPRLTRRFELGRETFVAFSPERVDPGNRSYGLRNTPKVIAGATPACLELAVELYSSVVDELVPVSSTDTAEMVKLLENTFRAVNIGLVNEIAIISRKLGVDAFEVIEAAATKPFGFTPFFPGPGLGGHCIPLDPLYLSWKLRTLSYDARFIELADSVNRAMPSYVVDRAVSVLNGRSRAVRGSHVLIYGVAYKRDVRDVHESPAAGIITELERLGAEVSYMDPWVPRFATDPHAETPRRSVDPAASFEPFDLVIIVTDHSALDRERLLTQGRTILDTRNALRHVPGPRAHVHSL